MEQIPHFHRVRHLPAKRGNLRQRLNPPELQLLQHQGLAGRGPLFLSETSIKIAQLWENPCPSGKENTSLAFTRKQSSIKALL